MDFTLCVVPCTVPGLLAKEVLTWVTQEYRPREVPRLARWDPGGDTTRFKSWLYSRQ